MISLLSPILQLELESLAFLGPAPNSLLLGSLSLPLPSPLFTERKNVPLYFAPYKSSGLAFFFGGGKALSRGNDDVRSFLGEVYNFLGDIGKEDFDQETDSSHHS